MAAEFELVGTEKAGAVVGTTTHNALDRSLYGQFKRTDFVRCTTVGSTYILSTSAHIDRLVITPISTGAGAVTLSDGTTAILSIPAAAHPVDCRPYTVDLGIRNTSTAGFKLVLGASVAAVVVGGFVGAVTTA